MDFSFTKALIVEMGESMFANGDAKPVNPVPKNLVGLRSIFICGQCGLDKSFW